MARKQKLGQRYAPGQSPIAKLDAATDEWRQNNVWGDIATGFIPGIGQIGAYQDVRRAVGQGNYGMAALSSLGMIPFLGAAIKPIAKGVRALTKGSKAVKALTKGAKAVTKGVKGATKAASKVMDPKFIGRYNNLPLTGANKNYKVINRVLPQKDFVASRAGVMARETPGLGGYVDDLSKGARKEYKNWMMSQAHKKNKAALGMKSKEYGKFLDNTDLHHIKSRAAGGTNAKGNLINLDQYSHANVHSYQGDKLAAGGIMASAKATPLKYGSKWLAKDPRVQSRMIGKILKNDLGVVKPTKADKKLFTEYANKGFDPSMMASIWKQ